MKKNKLNILDCTLRESSYYNNWYFEKDLIKIEGLLKKMVF